MFQTKVVEKIKTLLMPNNIFFETLAVYEVTWKNIVKPDRPQMTIKHGACALHAGYIRLQTHAQNM